MTSTSSGGSNGVIGAPREHRRIAFYGHFGGHNFGNDLTLETILHHLRRFDPDAEVTCICTSPDAVTGTYHVSAVPLEKSITWIPAWQPGSTLMRLVRRLCIGVPTRLYLLAGSLALLVRTDALIVPGTGLLNDAYGVFAWGPLNIWKWTLMAKLCRCKVFFVSVGAGPIYGTAGKMLVRSALAMADGRSYRDDSSKRYLRDLGMGRDDDPVYPDLVFSYPVIAEPRRLTEVDAKPIIGVGLMDYAWRYSVANPSSNTPELYRSALATFVEWAADRGNRIRLLTGDMADLKTVEEFVGSLPSDLAQHVTSTEIDSVGSLLVAINDCDLVVATRFHNVLVSLLYEKPTIAIAFHHKCDELMRSVQAERYCLDINSLDSDQLIAAFEDLVLDSERATGVIRARIGCFRALLEEQYDSIFARVWPDSLAARAKRVELRNVKRV